MIDDGDWQSQAECRPFPTSLFFADDGGIGPYEEAKKICGLCPVRDECLEWAIGTPNLRPFGFFGGMTPRERHLELRRRENAKRRLKRLASFNVAS